ncbi:MAG: PfkB family carbohydrate kinase [Rickettsiales bacterium]
MTHKVFAGIGEILWDVLPTGKQLGGAPSNFAYHAKTLMQDESLAYVVSRVGDDDHGREMLARLKFLRVNVDHVGVDPERVTGTATVRFDAEGAAQYDFGENVAWDAIPALCRSFAGTVDAVCFGTLAQRSLQSREAIMRFLRETKPDCLRIFDVNLRQRYYSRDLTENSLRTANVVKINDEELPKVARMLDMPKEGDVAALNALVERYDLRLGILTRGARGSVLTDGRRVSVHAGHKAALADAIGAGDSFTAAVAVGTLLGMDLDAVNDAANRVAAYVCTQRGATPPLPEGLRRLFTEAAAPAVAAYA